MSHRILLVEDDPLSRNLVRGILAAGGYAVDAAADSFEGVRLAREHRYGLALVDYHLPDLDGYASARLLRDAVTPEAGAMKLVALTADRGGLLARSGVASLFDAVLAKPIEPAALLGSVAAMMGAAQPSHPAEAGASAAQAFLRDPGRERARAAAEAFWRSRGLPGCPKVAAFPPPIPEQAQALSLCFDVVAPEAPDLILLLDRTGLDDVHAFRLGAAAPSAPLVTMGGFDEAGDAAFRVNDPASWSEIAATLLGFAGRRAALAAPEPRAGDIEGRLLAYLFVADRPLRLPRDRPPREAEIQPASGGFESSAARLAAARLQAAGLLAPWEAGAAEPWTAYLLTEAARARLTGAAPPSVSGREAGVEGGEGRGAAGPSHRMEAAPRPGARVLLVEDVEINRQIAAAMLQAAGHRVDAVQDGAEAVAAVQRSPYDLVLMDVQMAGMDGLTAARHIRSFGYGPDELPILGLTADPRPALVEELLRAGMNAALPKPFNREALCAAVARWRRAEPVETPAADVGLDRAVYDELLALIGRDQVWALLDRLSARLVASFDGEGGSAEGRARIGRDAHAMVSAAGMLGFQGLSEACRALEAAALSGEGVAASLAEVRALRRATLGVVGTLKRSA